MTKAAASVLSAALAVAGCAVAPPAREAAPAPAPAPAPAARAAPGPERVDDWYEAGRRFVREARALRPIEGRARNVILFVGDGMGVTTQTAARILEGQRRGAPGEENRLSFETLPYSALAKTYSWDQQTADSAPTATALLTGYKTRAGMLSVSHAAAGGDCDAARIAQAALPTLLELAARDGRATGVVTTTRLTHATPAAAYAHASSRGWEADDDLPRGCGVKDIARQLIELPPDVRASLKVALGGGRRSFLPTGAADLEHGVPGRRRDGRDLVREWLDTRGAGARYVWSRPQFEAADPARTEHLLGLFEPSHMQYEADRAQDPAGEPSLTEMTDKAIRMLQRHPRGFFLLVEGGRIDHAHHAGNAARALGDTIELSNAVRRAMELTREDDTLLVVTADHSHVFSIAGYPHRGNPILGLVRGAPGAHGEPPPPALDRAGLPFTTLGYLNGPGADEHGRRADLTHVDTTATDYRQAAAVPLRSETHGGEDVAVWARGPQAHLLRGSIEQNWIFHVMREAFGF